eukprot:TRINITY_DN8906_c0_g1_i1.p1 TRINITY_DN8906_c0_g1~~TRINITY_DN8906_c0_g1_i1.p1  ORF type:complete len:198 (+),score=41.88 TRINITY_DN8906_c0_g1_i1:340-933(+)
MASSASSGASDPSQEDDHKHAIEESTIPELVSVLNHLQEQRVQIYRRWEEGFRGFLQGHDLMLFRHTCSNVTALFVSISKDINDIEEGFKKKDRQDLATLTREIQGLEKQKLQITTQRQVFLTSWFVDSSAPHQAPAGGCHGHGHGHAHGEPRPIPPKLDEEEEQKREEELTTLDGSLRRLEAEISSRLEDLRLEAE